MNDGGLRVSVHVADFFDVIGDLVKPERSRVEKLCAERAAARQFPSCDALPATAVAE